MEKLLRVDGKHTCDRRRFLKVLGGSVVVLGCSACGVSPGGTWNPPGVPGSDAGTGNPPRPDAGTRTPDAGTPTPDAGTPTPDAGTPTPDAGTPTPDAGMMMVDAGPPCSNAGATNLGMNNDACGSNAGHLDLGPVTQYSAMGLQTTSNSNANVLIGRDGGGLYALSSLCTHQCCDMAQGAGSITGTEVQCTCHGSVFGADGSVIQGPARQPLDAYALNVDCNGHLFVDTTQIVPSSQRLMA